MLLFRLIEYLHNVFVRNILVEVSFDRSNNDKRPLPIPFFAWFPDSNFIQWPKCGILVISVELGNHKLLFVSDKKMTEKRLLNCWEYMKCGREPNGVNVEESGCCPAASSEIHNGLNRGVNAGRFCWKIVGTLCSDSIKGVSAIEIESCLQCPFFKEVEEEEGSSFR